MTTFSNRSASSRWRLRAAATAVAGIAGFGLVGGGTAFAAKAPPPPKPAPAPKPAPPAPTNTKPTPPPPAPKPTQDPQAKQAAQGYLKATQQNEANIHKLLGQANGLVGKAVAAAAHARNAAKQADQQVARFQKAAQGISYDPAITVQMGLDDTGAKLAAADAQAAADAATTALGQITEADTQAKTAVQTATSAASTADTDPTGVGTAQTQADTTTTLLSTATTTYMPSVQTSVDAAQTSDSSTTTYQQATQQDANAAIKQLAFFRTNPYVAPTTQPPTTQGSGGGDTTGSGTQTGGTGGTQTGGTGGTQTGGTGGTQTGGSGGTQTGGNNGGGVSRQPVPVVTIIEPSAPRVPATTGTTVVTRQPASKFTWQLPAHANLNPSGVGTTNVLGQKFHQGTTTGKPGRMPLGVGRQHVGTSSPGFFHIPASLHGLGWIPFLAILLLVEVLILARRFVVKARERHAHRTGAPAMATAKAEVLVPAPKAAKKAPPKVAAMPVAGLRRVMSWRHSGRPIWKPVMPAIGSSGRAGPKRL